MTDPEAKLMRRGDGRYAKLAFVGHAAMENRHGLCVLFEVKPAAGSAAEAAVQPVAELLQRTLYPRTVVADLLATTFLPQRTAPLFCNWGATPC